MKTSILIHKEGLCEGCENAEIEIQDFYDTQYARCIHESACNRAYEYGLHDGANEKHGHVDEVTE